MVRSIGKQSEESVVSPEICLICHCGRAKNRKNTDFDQVLKSGASFPTRNSLIISKSGMQKLANDVFWHAKFNLDQQCNEMQNDTTENPLSAALTTHDVANNDELM